MTHSVEVYMSATSSVLTDVPLVLENNAEFRIEFYNVISLFKDEVCLFH